jgi:hypothetical protein
MRNPRYRETFLVYKAGVPMRERSRRLLTRAMARPGRARLLGRTMLVIALAGFAFTNCAATSQRAIGSQAPTHAATNSNPAPPSPEVPVAAAPERGEGTPPNPNLRTTENPEWDRISIGLKEAVALSASLSQWALLLLGGALLSVFSTSYYKPSWRWRWVYLVFFPAFALLARVLERGTVVHSSYSAMLLRPHTNANALEALGTANPAALQQQWAFRWAATFLAAWTFVYLIWWIVADEKRPTEAQRGAADSE